MTDYTRYFDKSPLTGYCLGPSGSGIFQPQPFSVEWTGSFDPKSGATLKGHSGQYFFPDTSRPNTVTFSFCFDRQSNVWLAYGDASQITVSFHSGNSQIDYSFAGLSPVLFNNSILTTGLNDTLCLYLKNNSNIYYKTSAENFSTERIFYSGNQTLKRIQVAKKLEDFYYRFGIYTIDINGDGSKLISDKFIPMFNENYNDFESENTGTTYNLAGWMVESSQPSGYFILTSSIFGDTFETTPTGNINLLTSGDNMRNGYFI